MEGHTAIYKHDVYKHTDAQKPFHNQAYIKHIASLKFLRSNK